MTFLGLSSLRKSFGAVLAVDDVDLQIEQGSQIAIVGPSASGKSTLLRLIAGFEQPDRGEISLDGRLLVGRGEMVPAHKRAIGYVAQDGALFPHLTVGENVSFGMPRSDPDRDAQVVNLLRMVGLDASIALRRPDQLSGGQQQRVATARALAQRPRLMLLDEPFSSLDANLRIATRKAVTDVLRSANITTVLVTHDQVEALSFADRVVVLQHGRIVQFGAPGDVYERPVTPQVAAYLGDAIIIPAVLDKGVADCSLGQIPVAENTTRGEAQIMVRPEQIELVEVSAGDAADPAVTRGKVLATDFGGSSSVVTIELLPTGKRGAEIVAVRRAGRPLQTGAVVRLKIAGQAHVFE